MAFKTKIPASITSNTGDKICAKFLTGSEADWFLTAIRIVFVSAIFFLTSFLGLLSTSDFKLFVLEKIVFIRIYFLHFKKDSILKNEIKFWIRTFR